MHLQNSLPKFLFKKEHFQDCSLIKTLSNAISNCSLKKTYLWKIHYQKKTRPKFLFQKDFQKFGSL